MVYYSHHCLLINCFQELMSVVEAEKHKFQREIRELNYQVKELQEKIESERENARSIEAMYAEKLQIATQQLEVAQAQHQLKIEELTKHTGKEFKDINV